MYTIVLNRNLAQNLWEQIKDIDDAKRLIVFTSKEKQSKDCEVYNAKIKGICKKLFIVKNYDRSWNLEQVLHSYLSEENIKISSVFAIAEYDLYRASKIREYYKISGFTPKQTSLFRNKIIMKDYLVKHNIKVAPYKEVDSLYDIYNFHFIHGFPLIFKYQEAGGAVGIKVLKNFKDIKKFSLEILASQSFEWPKMMVEKFIFGTMYHVDGLASKNKVLYNTANKYINQGIAYLDGLSLGSIVLSQNNEISKRLIELNKQIIKILPIAEAYGFHNEFFINKQGDIILCEITARVGGGAINNQNAILKDVNMVKALLEKTLNPSQDIKITSKNMSKSGGHIYFTTGTKKGKIIKLAKNCPYDYVKYYKLSAEVGDIISPSVSCMNNLATIIFEAEDENEAEERLKILEDWFQNNKKIAYVGE